MGYTIGKGMTAYPRHAMVEQGSGPLILNSAKIGSTLTCSTGIWQGLGSFNPRFQWMLGGSNLLNATNQSFSVQSASNQTFGVRLSMGNAVYGTWYKDATLTGTPF